MPSPVYFKASTNKEFNMASKRGVRGTAVARAKQIINANRAAGKPAPAMAAKAVSSGLVNRTVVSARGKGKGTGVPRAKRAVLAQTAADARASARSSMAKKAAVRKSVVSKVSKMK